MGRGEMRSKRAGWEVEGAAVASSRRLGSVVILAGMGAGPCRWRNPRG